MSKNNENIKLYPENTKELDTSELGQTLKSAMFEQSLSIRKLSKLTGICTASISRIINNKQPASIHHLQKFSKHLGIPIEQLLLAINIGSGEKIKDDSYFILNMIQDILKSYDMDLYSVIADIKKELNKYEQYANTEEGKNVILNEYMPKIKAVNGSSIITEQLNLLYKLFCSKDTEISEKAIIGSALLYFILSIDIIPDYVFPIGYLDDAIAVNLTVKRLPKYFNIL